jgi:truncated hemoglobin YjbI
MSEGTRFEELGGEPTLRAIIDRFVDRIFDDVMIGFFFRNASRERVKAKEYEVAAGHLGADVVYTGRPLGQAHAPHRIMGGQFMRRQQILKETLREFKVPEAIEQHWLEHTAQLMPVITSNRPDQCIAESAPNAEKPE